MAIKFLSKVPIYITFIDPDQPSELAHELIKPKGGLDDVLGCLARLVQAAIWLGIGYGLGYLIGSGR